MQESMQLDTKYLDIYQGDRYCLMCRHVCPVARVTRRESATPHGWALLIHSARQGLIPWDDDSIDILYQCADCGLCQASCATRRPLPAAIVAARAEVAARYGVPAPLKNVEESLRRYGNPFGQEPPKPRKRTGRIGLFVGASYFERPESVEAAQKLLEKEAPVLLGMGRSSGYLAYTLGLWELARIQAQNVLEEIESARVKEVITVSREDAHSFRNVYPELDVAWPEQVRVTELVGWLERGVSEGRISVQPRQLGKFTYHDPCHTPRIAGDTRAGCNLAATLAGEKPREMLWREKAASPCGAIGGLQFSHPQLAAEMARARIAEARNAGAELLLTEDPGCVAHLQKYSNGVRVASLIELLAGA